MKKKIVVSVIGLLVIGVGMMTILYFNGYLGSPKKESDISSDNKSKYNNDETKENKDEYYRLYFENGKILVSLNNGDKKYLMDELSKINKVIDRELLY